MNSLIDTQNTGVESVTFACAFDIGNRVKSSRPACVNTVKKVAVDVVVEFTREGEVRARRVVVARHVGRRGSV